MIWFIVNRRTPLFWLVIHIILGILSTVTPWILIIWFYLVLLTSLGSLITRTEGSFVPLVFIITYATSFELLARMSGTSPYIPYELGKYLLLLLLGFGILKGFRRGYIGWLMVGLLLPAVFIDVAEESSLKNIVFNLIGPVNVALAVVFFTKQEIAKDDLVDTMKLLLYPLVAVLAFTIIKAPDLEEAEFTLNANFEMAGGFGTNQVSTALGLGAFLVFVLWLNKWDLSGNRWLDIALFVILVFRGLLTFSRGGMIGGAIGIIVILLFQNRINVDELYIRRPVKTMLMVMSILLVLVFTFIYADKITGGKLALRYQGETPGTFAGRKEKTLNVITSNRIQIFSDDLKLWKEYPVFGSGVGASRYLRSKTSGFLSHIEFSRLLSEHGIPGLLYIVILLKLGINIFRARSLSRNGALLLALYLMALFTTFHSAMRTYISPILFGLSLLSVQNSDIKEDGG